MTRKHTHKCKTKRLEHQMFTDVPDVTKRRVPLDLLLFGVGHYLAQWPGCALDQYSTCVGFVGGLVWGTVSAVLLLIRTENWSGSPDVSSDLDPWDYAVACCCTNRCTIKVWLWWVSCWELRDLYAGSSKTACKEIDASGLEELGALLSPTMATITHMQDHYVCTGLSPVVSFPCVS